MALVKKMFVSATRGMKMAAFLCVLTAGTAAMTPADAAAPVLPKQPVSDELPFDLTGGLLPRQDIEGREAALEFVRNTGITKNLSLLLLHDVKDEAPVQAAIKRYGMSKVQSAVVRAIRHAQNAHAADWDEMLATIYQAHFDAAELQSLAQYRDASPHFVRLLELQEEIANAVKDNGRRIFNEARAEVMQAVQVSLPI